MNKNDYIDQHYAKVAQNFGVSSKSTIQDPVIRNLEYQFLVAAVQNFIDKFERYPTILDMGCGNGLHAESLAHHFPECFIVGIEKNAELFKVARDRSIHSNGNLQFHAGSILDKEFYHYPFDIIFTERVLINLTSFEDQLNALENIAKNLSPCGLYLMIESFEEALQNLNKMRKQSHLSVITPSKHNLYLKTSLLRSASKFNLGSEKMSVSLREIQNQIDSHFFHSRILHPIIRLNGSQTKENLVVDFLNAKNNSHLKALPISPIQFYQFFKKV